MFASQGTFLILLLNLYLVTGAGFQKVFPRAINALYQIYHKASLSSPHSPVSFVFLLLFLFYLTSETQTIFLTSSVTDLQGPCEPQWLLGILQSWP